MHYGTTEAMGSLVKDSKFKTSHSFRLTGLQRNKRYYVRVTSLDAAGNAGRSDTLSFVTSKK